MTDGKFMTIARSLGVTLTALSGCLTATDSPEPDQSTELQDWNVYHATSLLELPMGPRMSISVHEPVLHAWNEDVPDT